MSSLMLGECAMRLLNEWKILPGSCEVHYLQLTHTVWTQINDNEWIYIIYPEEDQPREDSGSIPAPTVGIFLEGEDSCGDHGLGRLVEFRFKAPPGTTSPSITTHTPSGKRNCASWASQPQK